MKTYSMMSSVQHLSSTLQLIHQVHVIQEIKGINKDYNFQIDF